MELSNEDNLRLNVLVHQDLQAIRIDESKMLVYALTGKGEARVELKPTCRDDKYLRIVREMLSTYALGSPGGYPVYLRRWTRMGEMREESLQGLLLLGESEAVVAVANSPQLNEEVARRAWWAMPDADIARRMLRQSKVSASAIGKELAAYLVDYLPFESEAVDIVESVRLILQPDLVDEATVQSLWSRASRKSAYYIGFLLALPDQLPAQVAAHPFYQDAKSELQAVSENVFAKLILQLLSSSGQSFIATVKNTMERLSDQHTTVLFLKAVQNYFIAALTEPAPERREFSEIDQSVIKILNNPELTAITEMVALGRRYLEWIESILALSMVGEALVDPVFSQTDAVGSVMRKRLRPVTEPMAKYIDRFLPE